MMAVSLRRCMGHRREIFNGPILVMMMLPSTLQIEIPASVDGAELSGLLACPAFLGLWEKDGTLRIYWQGSEGHIL